MGSAPLLPALREVKQLLCVQSLILYYIKQIDSMLACICPVIIIDHRGRQNVVRTSVTHSAIAWCATFLSLPHFDVICDLLLDRCMATWNLFVKQTTPNMYISICFLPQYQRQRKCFFFSERELKKALRRWHIDTNNVVWSLIDNSKIAKIKWNIHVPSSWQNRTTIHINKDATLGQGQRGLAAQFLNSLTHKRG